jgi:hypothetical protein
MNEQQDTDEQPLIGGEGQSCGHLAIFAARLGDIDLGGRWAQELWKWVGDDCYSLARSSATPARASRAASGPA